MGERVLLIDGLRLLDHDGSEVAVIADRPNAGVIAVVFSYALTLGAAAQQAVLAGRCLRDADGVEERTRAMSRFVAAMNVLERIVHEESVRIAPPAATSMN